MEEEKEQMDGRNVSEEASFENNLEKLERVVDELEEGDLPLDDALALYEEGLNAYRNCHTLLKNAETQVMKLSETLEGMLAEEPFEVPEQNEV
ncbi:MAG: exodeoxyribonuclease VII small subunit [Planctomycetota bacterium]